MKKEIYELQQISVWGQRYPKRRMHLQRIGIFDSLKDAEGCMRLYIKDEKARCQSWGRDYSKECLGYLINSQQILQKELPDFNYHPLWWSYNANGEANDHSLANVHGDFYGRPVENIRFQVGDIVEVVGLKTIGIHAFGKCATLENINLPESLTKIEDEAFIGWKGLATVSFPAKLKSIGSWAFEGCVNLKTVTLPEGIEIFEKYEVFKDCTALESINIPASLTNLGHKAFKGCTALKNITVDPANPAYVMKDGKLMTKDLQTQIFPVED